MTKKDDALKLALDYVLTHSIDPGVVFAAIKDALEQPEQEPYGQVTVVRRPGCVEQYWFYRWPEPPYLDNAAECHMVYTSPPQRKPLTDEQKEQLWCDKFDGDTDFNSFCSIAEAIEAAHGIK